MIDLPVESSPFPIAIVGIGCRLPGNVHGPESFWSLLMEGRSGICEVPADRWSNRRFYHRDPECLDSLISKWGGFAKDIDKFDPRFWGISPREAVRMDPQQRWLLESAWESIEDSGTPPSQLRNQEVGVFVGIAGNDYGGLQVPYHDIVDAYTNSGSTSSIASNRISYMLDLKGPSLSVDTACSSSLVAVWLACESMWLGRCNASLVGGVNAIITPHASIGFSRASMLSPSGQCFAFDARADGYVRGEGAGVVFLKPLDQALADKNRIYAVIRGAAANQDGHTSSMTVPGVEGQSAMLRKAYQVSGIDPKNVVYVEAHGTGTPVGDPIELTALGRVLGLGRSRDEKILIGSVKTNIGHLEAGSGIAGLIKAALVLHHKTVPKNANFHSPNPNIPFESLSLRVATENQPLPELDGILPIIGVNSFGFGGTNAHVVLEAAPNVSAARAAVPAERPFVLPISAKDEDGLRRYAQTYLSRLDDPSLRINDFCSTAGAAKEHHDKRLIVCGADAATLRRRLRGWLSGADGVKGVSVGKPSKSDKELTFVYTGQGAQWWAMGQQLLNREPVFRKTLTDIDTKLKVLSGWSLLDEMTYSKDASKIDRTNVAQPAIFALQVGLTKLWESWGVTPTNVIGHSVGEVAAAYCAGIYSLQDAVTIIFHRSRLQHSTGGYGRMLVVGLSQEEANQAIGEVRSRVQVAVINNPNLVTLAGDTEPLESLAKRFEAEGRFMRWLPIDYAFHTHQMEPIREELLNVLGKIRPCPSRVPFVSTVTGRVLNGTAFNAEYWWQNVREPVLFGPAIISMLKEKPRHFLEIGPHPALASSLQDCQAATERSGLVLHSLRRETDETNQLLENLTQLHLDGFTLDWTAINCGSGLPERLPSYPFARDVCWLETEPSRRTRINSPDHPLLGLRTDDALPTWRNELDLHRLPFLGDHRLWDSVVFPGAGYIEMGLGVAKTLFPKESLVLEDVVFHKAMFVSQSDPSQVQVTYSPQERTFSIYSRPRSREEWELNASGRLVPSPTNKPKVFDVEEVIKTLSSYSSKEKMYSDFQESGFQFGSQFQLLSDIYRGSHQLVGNVTATDLILEQHQEFEIHPSILDACFQISAASRASENAADNFLLPAKVKRIQIFAPQLSRHLRAIATVTQIESAALECDICLVDNDGVTVVEVVGFRAERAPQAQTGRSDSHSFHYKMTWNPQSLKSCESRSIPRLPKPSSLVRLAQSAMETVSPEMKADIYSAEFIPKINAITPVAIQNAYLDLGWKPQLGEAITVDSLMQKLGIIGKFRRLITAYCDLLCAHGTLSRVDADHWQVEQQPIAHEIESQLDLLHQTYGMTEEIDLLRLTTSNLAGVLCGDTDPIQLFFPSGHSNRLRAFYMNGSDLPCMHELIRRCIHQIVETLDANATLRVLEVGGGTASLTSCIASEFPADRTEYVFTDIGGAFLGAAKQALADYPFIEFQSFDLEKDATDQGIQKHSFDLILATNVIHATADLKESLETLKSLLTSNGVLLFVEVMKRALHAEGLLFGLLDGWWRFTDTELRPASPLLSREQWLNLIEDCGFEDASSFATTPRHEEAIHVAFVAKGTDDVSVGVQDDSSLTGKSFVVLADEYGLGDEIGSKLSQRGAKVIKARLGDAFESLSDDQFFIDPECTDHFQQLLDFAAKEGNEFRGVVHCWNASHDLPETLTTDSLRETHSRGVLSALRLLQCKDRIPAAWFLVDHVYPIRESDRCAGLAASPVIGFARVANNECYPARFRILDLGGERGAETIEACFEEIVKASLEAEIGFRSGRRYLPQLQREQPDEIAIRKKPGADVATSGISFRLESRGTGILQNLEWNETRISEPGPNEISIRVEAGGINFRDVMKALGTYPGNPVDLHWYGDDFAGTVVAVGANVLHRRVGDRVAGMAPYAFQSTINVDARMVFPLPDSVEFEEAATLPTVFLTAHYAMLHLARLMPGESILIHGGTGGVGQAAIQIAKKLGLTIFATAGSEEKRRLLTEQGVHHVLNSRTLEFSDQVMQLTNGKGVDAVLNSLAGEFIPKSLKLLAPYGRFLEIGKIDVYGNSKLGMEQLKDNISFFVIDLGQHHICRQAHLAQLFEELAHEIQAGHYKPLPFTSFPISQCVDAFRFMAQGKHVGKNVLAFRDPSVQIGPTSNPAKKYKADGTYLITGGAGGFGLELAKSIVEHGAQHVVLMSRSGPRDEECLAIIEEMRQRGAQVVDARGDVCRADNVERIVTMISDTMPPLVGVFHAAMLLDDALLVELTAERFEAVLDVKALGGWNLHCATKDLAIEHFVCFSSVSSILGAPKQSNYNAGNCFLDTLAHYRRSQGLPAISIAWGALRGAGFVERNQKTAEYLEKTGMLPLQLPEALHAFHQAVDFDETQLAIAKLDWALVAGMAPMLKETAMFEKLVKTTKDSGASGSFSARLRNASKEERLELTKALIAQQIAGVFGVTPDKIEYDTPLNQMGLDSLMAVELKIRVEKEATISLPMNEIMNGPTLTQFATVVLAQIDRLDASAETNDSDASLSSLAANAIPLPQSEWSPLELYQPVNGVAPLFCIHPLGGDTKCYNDLAKYTNGRPIVALRGRGSEGLYDAHPSMSEMISSYFDAIRTVQSKGPYHLAGWSAGGIFAYELARQLLQSGEEVASLTLIDTPLPSIYSDTQLDDDVGFLFDLGRFANWFKGSHIDVTGFSIDEIRKLDEESRWQFAFQAAHAAGALPQGAPLSYIRKVVRAAQAHALMIRDYEIDPLGIVVNLVRPVEPDVLSQITGKPLTYDMGWKEILNGQLQLIESPGDHFTMMQGENAFALAALVTGNVTMISETR